MKQTQKLAVGGLMTAFAAVIMLISNFIPSATFVFPAAAGIIVYILSMAAGNRYAWISFFAVSVLSFFICTDRMVSLCFILFLGYYPLIKGYLEKIRPKALSYIVRFLVFNAAATAVYALLRLVFSTAVFERWTENIVLKIGIVIAFNVIFLMYDLCITIFFRKYKPIINNIVTKFISRF